MLVTSLDRYLKTRKGVIHIGAHDGEERDWYVKNGFSPVIWFEPNKELFPRLQENLEGYEFNYAFNFGVHCDLQKATLHISNNDGQSSSILPLGTHAQRHPDVKYIKDVEIPMIRMDEFFDTESFDIADFNFLNIDVQGVELEVIKSFSNLISNMDYIYTEVNLEEVYKGCALLDEIDAYLRRYGFVRVEMKITKAYWGDALYKRYS